MGAPHSLAPVGSRCNPSAWFISSLPLCSPPEVLSEEDKLKMSKIKKKMRRKVRAWGSGAAQVWVGVSLVQGVPERVLSSP